MGGNEHGGGHGFHGNPVLNAMTALDVGHAAGEMVIDGGAGAGNWKDLAKHASKESGMLWNNAGTAAQRGLNLATGVMSPLAIAGGTMEVIDGVNQLRHGDSTGAVTATSGLATAGSGIAGLAGLAGSGAAAAAAPVLSAAGLGLKFGSYGNGQVKERGWLHDREGENASASEWAADNAQAADEWVSERTWGPLGTAAGLATWYGSSIAGAGMAAGAGIVGAGEALVSGVPVLGQEKRQTGGTGLDAFHQGIRQGSGQPTDAMGAFHQGIANGSGGPRRR